MHVLFASFNYPSSQGSSGVGVYVYTMAQALRELGHEVSVVSIRRKGEDDYFEDDRICIYTISIGNIHWYVSKIPVLGNVFALAIRELEYSYAMWRKVQYVNREKKIDLLEGIETGMFFLIFFRQPFPIVMKLHGERYSMERHIPGVVLRPDVKLSRIIQRWAIKKVAVLISPSKIHAEHIREEIRILDKEINIINNSIDPFLYKEAKKISILRRNSKKIVLFVGRLELRKGILALLNCIPKIIAKVGDVTFIIAGGYHPRLKKEIIDAFIQKHKISKYIQMLGAVSRDRLVELYRKATVCALPSYYESFGLVYLEAMAFKKPIVAFNTGGAKEIIIGGLSGILVKSDDIDSLAGAIIKLISNSNLCEKMGEAGFGIVEKKFAREEMINKSLAAYTAISKGQTYRASALSKKKV